MSVRFQYPGDVLPHEVPTVEIFERDVVPYVVKHGARIGEAAMQGDLDAEEVIRRYAHFVNGMPHLRPMNLRICIASLKRWESKSTQ